MNIWILTSEFPPDYGGGISMYVNHVAAMFVNAGHKVTVLVRDPKISSVEENGNLRVVRFKHMVGEYYDYLGYWTALSYQYAEEVMALIKKDGAQPDIIEVQDYNAIGYYLLIKKWQKDPFLNNVPVLLHMHTPTFELDKVNQAPRYKFPNYWIGRMEKFCILAADAVLSPSEFLKNKIQELIPGKKIHVINLPYDVEQAEMQGVRDLDSNTFLYIGRTEYRKGVVQMLKGIEELWSEGYDFKLKIVGGDTYFHPYGENLGATLKKRYSNRIDEGKLVFVDSVPPSELNPEMLKSRAVIVPSLYENFPYTCLTSMWLGTPMLVSKSGGQAEMVGNDSAAGFVFDWNKEGDFQKKIIQILSLDHKKLQDLSEASRMRIVEMCKYDRILEARLGLFERTIERVKLSLNTNVKYPVIEPISRSVSTKKHDGEKGKLSIVIPYYNLGIHFKETMNSAQSIDYNNYEIIIVNDGTSDSSSLSILENYRTNSKIKVIDIKNGGLANARNVGVENANGEFVAFLDADDLIEPNFYSKAINILNSYSNVSFVYSWLRYFGNSNGVWPTFNTDFPFLLASNMLSAFVVVRKNDFQEFGRNKTDMEYGLEDYEGWISMVSNGCIGVSIPEPLVNYRVRSDSMSRQFNRDMLLYLRDRMSHLNHAAYEKNSVELFNLIDANGPGYLWDNPSMNYPLVGYGTVDSNSLSELNAKKHELMRIASSKWGNRVIKLLFKLKINRFFR